MKSVSSHLFYLKCNPFIGCNLVFFEHLKRPGVYPPKQILKKRAAALAGGGVISIVNCHQCF